MVLNTREKQFTKTNTLGLSKPMLLADEQEKTHSTKLLESSLVVSSKPLGSFPEPLSQLHIPFLEVGAMLTFPKYGKVCCGGQCAMIIQGILAM